MATVTEISVQVGHPGFTLNMGHALKAFRDIDFDACYGRAMDAQLDGVPFRVIHLHDLLQEKPATGRTKDLADAEELKKIADRQQNTD
ncbi:hypothetical protein GCM10023187_29580 [Nibrella viscosa]|uniref:Uncharacterized protein n=1 Tax=Nibrella viscosa TaxID=1084524 RepID=A0ABP8KJB9_9BACT